MPAAALGSTRNTEDEGGNSLLRAAFVSLIGAALFLPQAKISTIRFLRLSSSQAGLAAEGVLLVVPYISEKDECYEVNVVILFKHMFRNFKETRKYDNSTFRDAERDF